MAGCAYDCSRGVCLYHSSTFDYGHLDTEA